MRKSTIRHVLLLWAGMSLLGPAMLFAVQGKATNKRLRKLSWDLLWKGAHSSDRGTRSAAMQALGLLYPRPVVVRLAEDGLKDKDAGVRKEAAGSLGEMHAASSIPALNKALSDNDITVAMAAARSLLLLKQKSGYDVFYSVLTGKRKSGQSLLAQQLDQLDTPQKMVSFAFDQGIGFLPYAGYAMEVLQALKTKDNAPIRAAAARLLTHDPDPRSGHALLQACFDKDWIVQVAALRAVAIRGDPSLLSGLQPAMQDDNTKVQYTAAAAVFHLASIKAAK